MAKIKKIVVKKKLPEVVVEVESVKKKNQVEEVVTKANSTDEVEEVTQKDFVPTVGLSLGITKNMGNYETFKVSAWGTAELLEGEEYDRAFERLSTKLEERLDKEIEKWA